MEKTIDCVVCGSCTVDILVRPFSLTNPIGLDKLLTVEPIQATTGGMVSNSGIALARLGARVAAFSCVGDDAWAEIIRGKYQSEGIDTSRLTTVAGVASSVTVVFVDRDGQRSFVHSQGAPRRMDRRLYLEQMDLFAASRFLLIGYYSLMPQLEGDLPEILMAVRETGCRTALDTAGDGGRLQPLDRILPHLDMYVPSFVEARSQTGCDEPRAIIDRYRACGAAGLLGVKLGARGALLSPTPGQWLEVPPVQPPGPVVDTTGAGDAFYAGLIVGLLRGLEFASAGQLAAAAGASCVTALGASAGLRDYDATAALAGLPPRGASSEK
jgi:sugar/nucleoside kinase (ribokinase family)